MSENSAAHPAPLTLNERVAVLETKVQAAVTQLHQAAEALNALQSAAAKMESTVSGYQKMASDFEELSQKIDQFLASVKVGRQAMWMLVKTGGAALVVVSSAIGVLVWIVEHIEAIGKLLK